MTAEPQRHAAAQPWMRNAACTRPEVDPDWWFAPPSDHHNRRVARLYCASCDVAADCLTYALSLTATETAEGIWAGIDASQLPTLRRKTT